MASVKICDGRTVVYQYDTGVSIELCDCRDFTECHFAVNDGIIRRVVEGNICSVPDAALVNAGTLTVYAFSRNDDGGQTQHTFFIHVMARPKPADYIDPPDEADYIDLIAERAAKALPLFIVHVERVDGVLRADKTPAEISEALNARRVCMLRYGDAVLNFYGWRDGHPAFAGVPYKPNPEAHDAHAALDCVVLDDGTVEMSFYTIKGLTANPLVFEGGVEASYNGSKETRINISNVVNNALTVAKESGDFNGEPGTSVTITSITQSTEDDGYSVVTFSDGKQLRVKNGSKGSAGEGGAGGGGVMTVVCTPTEDGASFTADKSFEEIGDALLSGQAVQAYVQGLNAVAQMFMFGDNMVVFSAVASLMGDNAAVTLMMMKDGTNTMSVTSLGGTCIVNISTGDDVNGTADMTGPELFEAASMGQPVYANFNGGMYAPAQLIDSTYAVFRIEIPGGVIMATIDEQGAVAIELSEGGSAGGGGGNVVAVTLTYDGNTIKPSHTSNEIYNLTQAGNTVLLRYGAKTFMPITIGDAECVFENMSHENGALGAVNSSYTTVTITADVVTIKDYNSQTVYPNPHPLVINGVSYDGSERVEIAIDEPETYTLPVATADTLGGVKVGEGLMVDNAGVLGVKPEGEWELIEAITYTAPSAEVIERSKHPDGSSYDFRAIMIVIKTSAGQPAGNFYCVLYENDEGRSNIASLATKCVAVPSVYPPEFQNTAVFAFYPGYGVYECWGASGAYGSPMEVSKPANGLGIHVATSKRVRRFKLYFLDAASEYGQFVTGSTITIWGVRA